MLPGFHSSLWVSFLFFNSVALCVSRLISFTSVFPELFLLATECMLAITYYFIIEILNTSQTQLSSF